MTTIAFGGPVPEGMERRPGETRKAFAERIIPTMSPEDILKMAIAGAAAIDNAEARLARYEAAPTVGGGAMATPGQIIDGLAQAHLIGHLKLRKFGELCRSGSSLLRTALRSPSALGRRQAMEMVASHLDEYAKLLGEDEGGQAWLEIIREMAAGGFPFSAEVIALLDSVEREAST